MDKKVKVIFEGKTQTNLTREKAIEKAIKIVYEQSKQYKFISADEAKYGRCPECGYKLAPVWFEEPENDNIGRYKQNSYTGRYHKAVDYLLCECCGYRECTDGSFDDDYYYYRKDE